MTVRVARDWRGVKYKVSECTLAELAALKGNAERADDEIHRFLQQIDRELDTRRSPAVDRPAV